VLTEDLRAMLRAPSNLLGIRDQALLLTGFAGAFRRSGLVALDVSDLTFGPEGLLIKIRRSKTGESDRPDGRVVLRSQPACWLFVTSAARTGEPERRIMRQTGHKSIEMVLRYVRRANAFSDNAALALGL
jgi:integrase